MSVNNIGNEFYFLGQDIKLEDNVRIPCSTKTWIGNNVFIKKDVLFGVHPDGNEQQELRIKVDDRTFIGQNVTMDSYNQIIIEQDVMVAANAYISDSQHEYSDPYLPPMYQGFKNINNILTIKRGVWIGHSSTIIGNITIGYGSVIGANSVVTFDIPSHTVVFGNPSRIMKIYDYEKQMWIFPQSHEELLEVLDNRGQFNGYDDKLIVEALKNKLRKIKS